MSGHGEKNGGKTMAASAPAAVATIDLHGYRKSEAIRALTDFLDNVSSTNKSSRRTDNRGRRRQDDKATIAAAATTATYDNKNVTNGNEGRIKSVWCLVITGTGAHSPDGRTLCFLLECENKSHILVVLWLMCCFICS